VLKQIQGVSVPAFMYGTAWKEGKTEELTRLALAAGFRAVDTANQRRHYVEAGVGSAVAAAISAGELRREDVFLQTKFTYAAGQDHRLPYDPRAEFITQVEQSFHSSLEHLQTDYVDSYVLHGPAVRRGLTRVDWEVWRTMESLQRAQKVRLIGVSNVSLEQLTTLHKEAEIKPAFVQNRCYAATGWDREVRAFCAAEGIVYQGFSLLTANPHVLASPLVGRIARRLNRSAEQIVFRFALEVGMLPLTGTTNPQHMRLDLEAFDFSLEASEVAALEVIAG
jgi:diketogulonate reductase-like aldo/keto reductase